jgi:hypothetical protein
MFLLNLKPSGLVWDNLNSAYARLAWTRLPATESESSDLGFHSDYVTTEVKPRYHRMCIPHGYLDFNGVTWRVACLNIITWLQYHLFELHD